MMHLMKLKLFGCFHHIIGRAEFTGMSFQYEPFALGPAIDRAEISYRLSQLTAANINGLEPVI
ncbi:hypothetical protein D3C87_1815630 [compost metagenome]